MSLLPKHDAKAALLHQRVQEAGLDGGMLTSEAIEELDAYLDKRDGLTACTEDQIGKPAIVVKPLVWTLQSCDYWDMWSVKWLTPYGDLHTIYRVAHFTGMGGDGMYDLNLLSRPSTIRYETLAAAQAVAQEEWNTFILNAIQQ